MSEQDASTPKAAPEGAADKLARLRKEKAKRDAEAEAEAEARELAELELDSKLSETGKRGRDYEILSTAFGVFALALPDAGGIAQFNKATKDANALDADRIAGILRHYVVPESQKIEFHRICTERPDVAFRAAGLVRALLGSEALDSKKKF